MLSKQSYLVKILLKATSSINILRFSKEKSKRNQAIGSFIGYFFIYILLIAYCVLSSIGYGQMGLAKSIPMLCGLVIVVMEFLFTLLKTNGYLFAFKEYDILMAMPFSTKTVVTSKFLYMYIKNLPLVICISGSMLVSYGVYEKTAVWVYPVWLVLSLFLPLIPMVIASALGALFAGIGSNFKYKQIIQGILLMIVILLLIFSRFFIESMFKEDKVEATLQNMQGATEGIGDIYLPIKWFGESVSDFKVGSVLLFLVSSVLIYELFFILISKFYKKINSKLLAGVASKKFRMTTLKTKSVTKTFAFKEFKRFIGSMVYLSNIGMGVLLGLVLAIVSLFLDMDVIIADITNSAPISSAAVIPAVPLLVHFCIHMMPSTACSWSLEGKQLWIIRSLPVRLLDVFKGKILFNLYLTVPVTIIANICVGISFKAGIGNILIFLITGVVGCIYASTLGMIINIKHPKLSWDNEIEPIKQGSAAVIYIFPHIFGTSMLVVGIVALSSVVNPIISLAVINVFMLLMIILNMYRIKSFSNNPSF